jgi:hypothetical protein
LWLARNAIGQWQALKAVYQSTFGKDRGPYEAGFKGLQRSKPVLEKHLGLLRIDIVSKMKDAGYLHYVERRTKLSLPKNPFIRGIGLMT